MVFSTNPLSLAVPDPVFETWLRDNRFLEILDDHAAALAGFADHTTSRAITATARRGTTNNTATLFTAATFLFSVCSTLVSVLTINPFAKLAAEDFAGDTPSWTGSFLGSSVSFSWPASPSQARMRVQENVKRYARNYAFLSVLILACCLYQIPIALLGIVSSLLMWELFRISDNRWTLVERFSIFRQILIYLLQSATAIIIYCCNVQISLFWALCVSYVVMLLHALLRKLTPTKRPEKPENCET
ncbi:PRA1 family protein H-like [Aristolochia californica]|uniref:PRA1 family protein H-like n=1 Tax=Aristolochia californica TaxID=171875 RepID=UPI0035DE4C64